MRLKNRRELKELRKTLRKRSTKAEAVLWKYLRRRCLGFKFFRQFSVGRYIADFCCPKAGLIIEVDGKIHDRSEIKEADEIRTMFLEDCGYKVVRFTNEQVVYRAPDVVSAIEHLLYSNSPL